MTNKHANEKNKTATWKDLKNTKQCKYKENLIKHNEMEEYKTVTRRRRDKRKQDNVITKRQTQIKREKPKKKAKTSEKK